MANGDRDGIERVRVELAVWQLHLRREHARDAIAIAVCHARSRRFTQAVAR